MAGTPHRQHASNNSITVNKGKICLDRGDSASKMVVAYTATLASMHVRCIVCIVSRPICGDMIVAMD